MPAQSIHEYIEMMSEPGITISKVDVKDFCSFMDDRRDNNFIVSKDGEKVFGIRNLHIYFGRIIKIKMNTITLYDPHDYRSLVIKRFGQNGYKELYKLQRAVENIYTKQNGYEKSNVSDVRGRMFRHDNAR